MFLVAGLLLAVPASADSLKCLKASGDAASRCLRQYTRKLERCRKKDDAVCEAALREEGGLLEQILAGPDSRLVSSCGVTEELNSLGYLDPNDIRLRIPEACTFPANGLKAYTYRISFSRCMLTPDSDP